MVNVERMGPGSVVVTPGLGPSPKHCKRDEGGCLEGANERTQSSTVRRRRLGGDRRVE